MKKIPALFIAMIIAMVETGCKDSDDTYTSYYNYRNDSSSEIHLESYSYYDGELHEEPNYTFTIPIGESYTLRFNIEGGYPYPFMWSSPTEEDRVVVTNDEKQFFNTRHANFGENKLFREDSYEIVKSNKKGRDRTYQYVFTDKDFENAQPIEP